MTDRSRRLLFVGNFLSAAGINRAYSEELSDRLAARGWNVVRTSSRLPRVQRLTDMVSTTWRHRNDYAVAHVDVFSGPAFLWAEAVCLELSRIGKPFVLTLHGGNLPRFSRRWPKRVRRLLASAAVVTAPSAYLHEQMRPYRDDILLLPNALNVGIYHFEQRSRLRPELIWLRAFHQIYNPVMAVEVLAKLRETVPDARLTMIGPDKRDGSLERVRAVAQHLGVEDSLLLVGQVPKSAVAAYLSQADIFINTTNIDNTPISVLEAMASGLPVVSTLVGGIPFLLEHERTALLVPPGDVGAMTNAVTRLLETPALTERLCRDARSFTEGCDWSIVLEQWEHTFDKLTPRRQERATRSSRNETVLFVGNFLSSAGANRGYSEELVTRLEDRGWTVPRTSSFLWRPRRLADMLNTIWSERHDYGIAHVDVFSGAAFLWAEAACYELNKLGKPYVLTLRGGNLPAFAREWPQRVRRLLQSAALVTAPSSYLHDNLRAYRNDIVLLRNAIECDAYGYVRRSKIRPKIVWVRALHNIYNPVLAVDVLARVSQRYPDATLTMIGPDKGDGSKSDVVRRAREVDVTDRLELVGHVPKAEVPRHLATGDIFINTTNIDNTPISVLESMAAGLCVVSTSVGGIPFLLQHEENALLVPPRDPDAMSTAVERLLADPALAAKLSEGGHRLARECDWQIVLSQWENIFRSLHGTKPGRALA